MSTNSPLPAHLERIGDQLVAAAEGLSATEHRLAWRGAVSGRAFAARVRSSRLAVASGVASLAAVAAAVVLLATAGATPAYALTQNADGSYTLTISDIAIGVPALNAKLKQLGIDAIAVPVTATCSAPLQIGGPGALAEKLEMQTGPGSGSGSAGLLNLSPGDIPAGSEDVIAAYQSPSGQVSLTLWTTAGNPPTCMNTRGVVPPGPATSN